MQTIKELAQSEGPCVTLILPLEQAPNTARQESARLKSLMQQASQQLGGANGLLDALQSLEKDDARPHHGGSLVVFRSPSVFETLEVRESLTEAVTVGPQFNILAAWNALQDETRKFLILALSQKHIRLLRCTIQRTDDVELPAEIPTNIDDWLGTSGSGTFTSTTDIDNKDEQLANFYRAVDKGLHEFLKADPTPIMLVGVDYETALYKGLSDLQNIVEQSVHGSPQSLLGGEMHKRAVEALEHYWRQPLERALDLYEKHGGTEKVCSDPEKVAKAASESRVSHLFVANDSLDERSNAAATQTIAFGGEVFVTGPGAVPGQKGIAALLRY